MRQKKLKPIPKFESEDEEREFWATHCTVDYIDWSKAERVSLPNLKLSSASNAVASAKDVKRK